VPYIGRVHPDDASHLPAPRLSRERGRLDDRGTLKLHLADAPSDYLEGALENPDLGPDELALLDADDPSTAQRPPSRET